MLAELLNLLGAVSATALSVNYAGVIVGAVQAWVPFDPLLRSFVLFWSVFLTAILLVHVAVRRLAELFKWEPFHWATRGVGLALGGVRGLWWSGMLLLAFTSTGFIYLRQSVEERSLLGPQLLKLSHQRFERVIGWFPGHTPPSQGWFPPLKPRGEG